MFDNQNTFRLAIELHENPGLTTEQVADFLRVSRSTAFRYLSQLENVGVIECKWEVSRSSAPKAVKSFSLTKEGRMLLEILTHAVETPSD